MHRTKDWEDLLDGLLEEENAGMSAKEIEYLEDLDNHYRDRDQLSYKQFTWLCDIYDRVFK